MSAVTLSSSSSVLGCQKHGHGPEKVLVFHDWMGDAANYEPLQPYLDREAFSYVFADLRGYGRSSPLAGEYTAGEAAGDAFALADALGWGRFHVVGHSMSGLIVQRMALDDWTRGERRLKSVVAITPVAADGYPADAPTRDFLWSLIGQRELSEQGFAALTGQRLSPIWARAKTERHLATSNPEGSRRPPPAPGPATRTGATVRSRSIRSVFGSRRPKTAQDSKGFQVLRPSRRFLHADQVIEAGEVRRRLADPVAHAIRPDLLTSVSTRYCRISSFQVNRSSPVTEVRS